MLTLTFFVALIMLALAVGLTPLGGWTKPAVWLALALLLSLLVALKAIVFRALVPLALLGTLALGGCGASWQSTTKTTLDAASAAAEATHVTVRSYYDTRCERFARDCAAARLPDCPSLKTCQEDRGKPIAALSAVQTACMIGYSAIAIADKPTALAKALEAARAVADLISALKTQGVMP